MKAISSEVFVNGKLLNTSLSFDEPEEITERLDLSVEATGSVEMQADNQAMKKLDQMINRSLLGW